MGLVVGIDNEKENNNNIIYNMAKRTIFEDEDDNQMDCYLNDKGKVFISISQKEDDAPYGNYITLDKDDVQELIIMLTKIESEME